MADIRYLSSHCSTSSLTTKQALALSLTPPRVSPFDSLQHALLTRNSSLSNRHRRHDRHLLHHSEQDTNNAAHSHYLHETLQERLIDRIMQTHSKHWSRLPHPHLIHAPNLGDASTRLLSLLLPLKWQHRFRDCGGFRTLSDSLVTLSAPSLAVVSPRAAWEFLQLTRCAQSVSYGHHARQNMDIYHPKNECLNKGKRLIVFWHGGAWGSGCAWMYRLVAQSFLEQGYVVAIPNYRVYPDGTIQEQLDDVNAATWCLNQLFPDEKYRKTIMGHSSGAHLALLALITNDHACDSQCSLQSFDSYIGLSGPYDIGHHFDYEAARGVEEISPMKPVNGYTRQAFAANSPAQRLQSMLSLDMTESVVTAKLPKYVMLLHGMEDATVPFTATAEAARILRSCDGFNGGGRIDEVYIAGANHSDTIVQLMLGGPTRLAVLHWIRLLDGLGIRNVAADASRHAGHQPLQSGKEPLCTRRLVIRSRL